MVKYDRSANGAVQTATGTPGGTISLSAQQNWVPPGNNQSTSRGGIPAHGIPLNQTPGPSRRSGPDSNKGKSRTKPAGQSGAPKQIINGNNAKVKNVKSFNNYNSKIRNNNIDNQDSDSEESSESESEGSSDCD